MDAMATQSGAGSRAIHPDLDVATSHIRVAYVVSNDLAKISSLLPSNKNRSVLVHMLVKQYGLLDMAKPWSPRASIRIINPNPASAQDLTMYHTRRYIDFILNERNFSERGLPAGGDYADFGIEDDCPAFPQLPQYVRLVGGAALAAANALHRNESDISICWDGGRHHAQKFKASGFCYVADCVLAIMAFKRSRISSADGKPRKPRIMYLDLDLHFSDGVSQAFYSSGAITTEPQVLTLSIHHTSPGFFPVSDLAALSDPSAESFDPYTLSLPLSHGASDATFARVWNCVESVKDSFQPDYVVVQCGVDGLAGDPYGIWNWSIGSSDGSLGWCVDRICHQWRCKTLLLGGGGYNHPNAARAWAYLTSVALSNPLSLDLDIPDHAAFPLYAPSFTLDVPPGTSQDHNSDEYLRDIQDRFLRIVGVLNSSHSVL